MQRASLLGLYRQALRLLSEAPGAPTREYLRQQFQLGPSESSDSEAFSPEQRFLQLKQWIQLQKDQKEHDFLLDSYGIGKRVAERDRLRVNAGRVGLKLPEFPDEKPLGVSSSSS